jgi:ABC-2 type transport system ATP-binding protein
LASSGPGLARLDDLAITHARPGGPVEGARRDSVETVLRTHKLTKRFGKFVAVRDLDLDVTRGEIYGFLGPNGAGKSTTIRMLIDLIRPSSGSAEIFGRNVRKEGTSVRKRIGYLPGELALYENLSPRQLYEYSGSLYGVKDLRYALELSERLKVTDVDAKIGSLSQGNKQKVGIVQSLLHQPQLAILDEPTNALDPLVRQEVYRILDEARSFGTTVFFSSHVLAEAERICDRVAIIREGELSRVGTVEELKAISPRRMKICFAGQVPLDELSAIPGVADARVNGDPNTVDLMVRENMDAIVKTAARYNVIDFYSEDVSLEEIFLGYYGQSDAPPARMDDTNGIDDATEPPGNIRQLHPSERVVDERPVVAVPAGDGAMRESETDARR